MRLTMHMRVHNEVPCMLHVPCAMQCTTTMIHHGMHQMPVAVESRAHTGMHDHNKKKP